ncbi:hypothetical protein LOTGIDRAFT_155851 [Lottia gigantea]|uniref:MADF domain-containing protein n=1 Tax=Lottia gigantea TaxID=225164 RepID=V4B2Q4_LOTGI|nr:hypothetical protein LOTGIDRAFT_155851 [Lottia gigantea]ESO82819.1 hypothetical protein LOTGIDRAFT_155851 [Lottia gigantea]
MATSSESTNTKFWTVEKEQILVDMWSQSAFLFMISSPDYSDRDKKYAAMQEIAQALETTDIEDLPNDVKPKSCRHRVVVSSRSTSDVHISIITDVILISGRYRHLIVDRQAI